MDIAVIAAITIFTLLCIWVAQRLALSRVRKPRPWMVAAAFLGPLPLIPLVLLHKPHA